MIYSPLIGAIIGPKVAFLDVGNATLAFSLSTKCYQENSMKAYFFEINAYICANDYLRI